MPILGITGSSGSGKSTVTKLFGELKEVEVFDADKNAKTLDYPGSSYLKEINDITPENVLLEGGNLNRAKLANIISKESRIREKVNEITKKYVLKNIFEFKAQNEDKKLLILDIPVLFENELEEYMDKILVVVSNREEQIQRISQRDEITEEQAQRRLEMQQDNEFYTSRADFVIENVNKSIADLRYEVVDIYNKLVERDRDESFRF